MKGLHKCSSLGRDVSFLYGALLAGLLYSELLTYHGGAWDMLKGGGKLSIFFPGLCLFYMYHG